MTPSQINFVRQSFEMATAKSDLLIASFNRRLFGDYPHLHSLVPSQNDARAKEQISAMRNVIAHLPNISATYEAANQIFNMDQGIAADSESCTVTAAALLGALRETLADEFTEAVEEAWVACYVLISRQFPSQLAA